MAGFGSGWRTHPALAAFDAVLTTDPDGDAIVAAADTLFADTGWLTDLIAALSRAARADPAFRPPFAPTGDAVHEGLLLIEHRAVTIGLSHISAPALAARKAAQVGGSIGFGGHRILYKLLEGAATLEMWQAPPIDAAFDAATRGPARQVGTQRLEAGGTLLLDGRREGFTIRTAAADLLMLQAMILADRAPVACEHDPVTGVLLAASATDPAASRMQLMADLLVAMRRDDAIPGLLALADHPAFFVRWHAARALHRLDRHTARALLERLAAADPHRDVRDAASQAIRRVPCPA